jgi:beta-lactamase regulating signal transducer with metallopeptidase domain
MSSLFALRALVLAAECLGASILLPSLAWTATRFLRDASLRHLVWLTAFGTLLVLPLASLIVPSQFAVARTADAADAARPVPMMTAPVSDPAPATTPATSSLPTIPLDEVALAAFFFWLVGACWIGSRLMIGAMGLHLLRRRSRPHALAPGDHPNIVVRGRECELRLSGSQDGPMTWGVFQPVILLPKTALSWTRERTQAVLLHELAHVRRRDSLTQSLSLLLCALYWPNPLVWLGARALRREAEIAADDAVLGSGMKPSAYAGELLQLASEFRGHGLAVAGVSMASRTSLEARVKAVLAPNSFRTGVTVMDTAKLVCLGVVATAALAFARPDVVDAQNVTPAAEPAVTAAPLPPADSPAVVPAPAEAATPAAPAVSAAPAAPASPVVRVHVIRHRHGVRTEQDVNVDQVQIDAAMERARMAEAELRKVEPQIEKAIAAAKIDEKVARAMADLDPRVRAEVARALAKARPAIRQAIADAHISEKVAQALREAQPRIDAAIAKARKAGHAHIVIEDDGATNPDDSANEQDEQRDEP